MTLPSEKRPRRRRSAHYERLQRQRAHQLPGVVSRLRGLQGRARTLLIIGATLVIAGVILGSGGTAYALDQENHDGFCASCHTEPESTYYRQSLVPNPPTLASFHAGRDTRCIDCHSGSGPLGRLQGLTQGAQDLVSYYSGRYHHPAITTTKLGDDSCAKCHGDISQRPDFNNHFHRFLAQWQANDPAAAGCLDCHTAHTTALAAQQYLQDATVSAVCQHCHAVLGGGG